jgi:hypothetical protein
MAIQAVKVRARIKIGNLNVRTPDGSSSDGIILSFNVTKSRATPSTFSASLKVLHTSISRSPIGNVEIYAGVGSASDRIFTGVIKSAKIRPCFDDPEYVLLDINGADVLSTLQGKKFTSRSRATKSTWMAITGVNRQGLRSGAFKPTPFEYFGISGSDIKETNDGVSTVSSAPPSVAKAPVGHRKAVINVLSSAVSNET